MLKVSGLAANVSKASLFLTEFGQDLINYLRYSGASPLQDWRKRTYYKIIIETHTIEKGLSMADPRPLFGKDKLRFIMKTVTRYGLPNASLPVKMAYGALKTYRERHRALGLTDPVLDEIDVFLDRCRDDGDAGLFGGVRDVASDPQTGATRDESAFLAARFSCRRFSPQRLPASLVEKIVRNAQSAPSQCNRQATHVHFFRSRSKIDELLDLQGGSSGFSQTVGNLFVVTSDLAAWGGAQQRNQAYVDGAIFATTLMLACNAAGVSTCSLNLAVTHATARRIRRAADIPNDQVLIFMIAAGYPAGEGVVAARSPRRPTAEILRFSDSPDADDSGR